MLSTWLLMKEILTCKLKLRTEEYAKRLKNTSGNENKNITKKARRIYYKKYMI